MRADDDLDAEIDLRHRSFGPMDMANREYWREEMLQCIAVGRQFGTWDDRGQMIGTARYHDMQQYWHGRPVRMAGVGGVKVAPEARGRGVGRAMMTALLREMAERGYALSVLYPATARIYRSLGWELAGGNYRAEVPGRTLGALLGPDLGPVEVHRATPEDAEAVIAVLGAVHTRARDCGPATRDPASVRRWLADPDLFSYLAEDGFLAYGWLGDSDKAILVEALQAGSPRTTSALWRIVASHASVTEVVHANVGPADPLTWLTSEADVSLTRLRHWMLRVLDPVAAIEGRGFPAAAQASMQLQLSDPDLPANAGCYRLAVAAGKGSLTRDETEPPANSASNPLVAFGPRGFAALYAGVPMATLRAAGLAAGGDQDADAALDTVFAAQSFLLDYF